MHLTLTRTENYFFRSATAAVGTARRDHPGDFNCVQTPLLDRLGGKRSDRPESAALQDLVNRLRLEDACTLQNSVEDDNDVPDPTDYFTYWARDTASRIDRFYVPQSWAAIVQWVSVEEPSVPSDHQCAQLHIQETLL